MESPIPENNDLTQFDPRLQDYINGLWLRDSKDLQIIEERPKENFFKIRGTLHLGGEAYIEEAEKFLGGPGRLREFPIDSNVPKSVVINQGSDTGTNLQLNRSVNAYKDWLRRPRIVTYYTGKFRDTEPAGKNMEANKMHSYLLNYYNNEASNLQVELFVSAGVVTDINEGVETVLEFDFSGDKVKYGFLYKSKREPIDYGVPVEVNGYAFTLDETGGDKRLTIDLKDGTIRTLTFASHVDLEAWFNKLGVEGDKQEWVRDVRDFPCRIGRISAPHEK